MAGNSYQARVQQGEPARIWGTLIYDYFRRRRAKLVTNMDGLEWKRSKWNFVLQRFAELTEALGAKYSDALISDNLAIRRYLLDKYGKKKPLHPLRCKAGQ